MTQPDKLTAEEVEVLLDGYRENGKITKASLAGALLESMRENERLRQMIMDATKPQIIGASPVVGIPEAAYNAMRDYRNKDSDNG